MMKLLFELLLFIFILHSAKAQNQEPLSVWYASPATDWQTEALPIGNAYMGAMIFGGVEEEEIQFNEETLWEGGPNEATDYNFGIRENAHRHLPIIRRLLNEGKWQTADSIIKKELTGVIHDIPEQDFGDFGSFQNFGSLKIKTTQPGDITNYRRELNLSDAVASVSYQAGKVKHLRTYFASYPRRAVVLHLENNAAKGTRYEIKVEIPHQGITHQYRNNTLTTKAHLRTNKMELESRLRVFTKGKVTFKNNTIVIEKARSATIVLTAATNYANDYPAYRGTSPCVKNQQTMDQLKGMTFSTLMQEHLADYHALFNRSSLWLGASTTEKQQKPTNERLEAYAQGLPDPALEALYYQMARYYLISSSRPGSMPATLQGKWNNSNRPPWACDYHTNINLQMIYWPAEVTNLTECHLPLANYIESLVEPGTRTTAAFFGAGGWTVNTMNNAFGYTAPGWGIPWGYFPAGSAWLCRHIWEHYEYTGDEEFLSKMMPTLTAAVEFWHHYLQSGTDGYISSSPSYSPEHGEISTGTTMDHQIVWDLYTNYLKACKTLNIHNAFTQKTADDLARILPLKVGRWGQLQEWREDVDDPTSTHRHVSHLYGLYPGHQITPESTPTLARAAQVTLNARGDGGTGWSLGWKINFRARLGDGNHAYRMLQNLLKPVGSSGNGFDNSGGTYPNMFCAHPPFQLDGNMGGAAGIAEMLMQSHNGKIVLLPALPDAWPEGVIKGLKARGNITVDIIWKNGKLTQATITLANEATCVVQYGDSEKSIGSKPGETIKLTAADFTSR